MPNEGARFVDEDFNVHEHGEELGRGGQGVVFRTKDPDVAVKVALDESGLPVRHAAYVEKLRRVRALPVPAGLHLAAPMAVLQEIAGYAMRLLNDMVPFTCFWRGPRPLAGDTPELPDWLSGMPRELAESLLSYRETGGLHRRLVALYKCSVILARLHAAGLVHGDVSPSNAFISRHPTSREVWLIDADNLRHETLRSGSHVYTPRFGAPEIVQGRDGGRPRTDCHAFAVMAFSMLTSMHPFLGALVEDAGGERDWAEADTIEGDAVEKAYSGLLPWVLDEDDDSNHKDNGLVDLVLTGELLKLFQETFGPGRARPWMRPTMLRWPPALARAADRTISCPGCRMGYYVDTSDDAQRCPFCDEGRPRMLEMTAYPWTGAPIDTALPTWSLVRTLGPGLPDPVLPHRLFHPFSLADGDRDVLELSEEHDELRLRCCEGGQRHRFAVACDEPGEDAFLEFEGAAHVPLTAAEQGFWLIAHSSYPRLLRCSLRGGVA